MSIGSIDSILNGSSILEDASRQATGAKKELGREDFLTLLLAQLRHQDPLNPLESTEFTAQLAQYSSLEQLFNVNSNLETIKAYETQGSLFQAVDFIGKEVAADGDRLSLEEGKEAKGSFSIGEMAQCQVLIYDVDGRPLNTLELGSLNPGQHTFLWDGRNSEGNRCNPGVYYFDVAAVNGRGQIIETETQITGTVGRVSLREDHTPLLFIGDIPLTISQISHIGIPGTSPEGGEIQEEGSNSSPDAGDEM